MPNAELSGGRKPVRFSPGLDVTIGTAGLVDHKNRPFAYVGGQDTGFSGVRIEMDADNNGCRRHAVLVCTRSAARPPPCPLLRFASVTASGRAWRKAARWLRRIFRRTTL